MSSERRGRSFGFLVLALCGLFPAIGFSRGADVTFRGAVTSILQSDAQHGVARVKLPQAELTVVINAATDIEVDGDAAGLSGLAAGDFVKVAGYYSSQGVVAREIQILDDKSGDFRLRGQVTAVVGTGTGVGITINGMTVLLDDDSAISQRGHDDRLSQAALAVGMDVDARGAGRDGRLVARALLVGSRSDDSTRVRFDGVIQDIQGSRLLVDTEGGGIAVVLMSASTTVQGSLVTGMRIEVKGNLNNQLEVEARIIKADDAADDKGNDTGMDDKGNTGGSDDKGTNTGGDDKSNSVPVRIAKAVTLTATAAGAGSRGEAELEFQFESGAASQKFSVGVEDVMARIDLHVVVTLSSSEMIDLGTLSSDSKGKAKASFSLVALPAGKDVRDIAQVQVTLNGAVILQGSF